MNYKKITLRFSLVSALTVILSTVLLLLCFKSSFDAESGYFVEGTLPTIFWIFYIAGIVLPFVATMMLNKSQTIKTSNEIGFLKIPFLVLAVSLTACAIAFNLVLSDSNTLPIFIGICFFAVYILLCAANKGYNSSALKILLIYLSATLPVSMIMYNNSNIMRHINSVENTLTVVFGLSFMTYILYEAKRIYLGMHSRWHFCSMLLTLHTGTTLSIAYILAYLSKSVFEKPRFLQAIAIFFVTCIIALEFFRFLKDSEIATDEGSSEADICNEIESEQTKETN